MSEGDIKNTIVTITDPVFFPAVFVLVLSLKRHNVQARINVLGVNLSADEKAAFNQLDGVRVFEADMSHARNPVARKGEAILTAEGDGSDYVTLLDGDSIVTGDITRNIRPPGKVLSTRIKSYEEDADVFFSRYAPDEAPGGIPKKMLDIWRKDVGERDTSALHRSIASGNFTIHADFYDFIRKWHRQIMKVLPNVNRGSSRDFGSVAYFQLDESVLESLLAFAEDAPPVYPGLLDKDPDACVAHLGPYPKPWRLIAVSKLRYHGMILDAIEWARKNGYKIPPLPWTFRSENKPLVHIAAYLYEAYSRCRAVARTMARKAQRAFGR